jgi:hypothetical protein
MNQIDGTKIAGRDERRLDLLVDGELGEEDRGALLRQLDREPGGWRRCALAFLEAQAWKRELPALLGPPGGPPDRLQPRRRWWWSRHVGTLLAMAASFLVALALGMRWHGVVTTAATATAANPWQVVTVAARENGRAAPQTFQLPAIQADRLDQGWFEGLPQPVSPDVLEALRQSGHEVELRRELLPVPMNDGRQLVVPVDQVDIRYVGRPRL